MLALGKHNKKKLQQKNIETQKSIANIVDKLTLKEAIIEAYKEIEQENHKRHMPTIALKFPMDLMLYILAATLAFFALVFLVLTFYVPITQGLTLQNVIISFIAFVFCTLCTLFCIIVWKASVELDKENNRNYIASYFSAIVSFVALIVALISCFR